MQQLAIRNGDIVLDGSAFEVVEGKARVLQDLRHALVEPYGQDRFHPRWGSVLYNFIGVAHTNEVDLLVRSEVKRIVNNLALAQREQITGEITAGRSKHRAVEVIDGVSKVTVRSFMDRLYVTVEVTMLSGDAVVASSSVAAA